MPKNQVRNKGYQKTVKNEKAVKVLSFQFFLILSRVVGEEKKKQARNMLSTFIPIFADQGENSRNSSPSAFEIKMSSRAR